MIAHVVSYTHRDDTRTRQVLCFKYDGLTPAVYSRAKDARNWAAYLGDMFPHITYQVQAVEL